MIIPSFFIAGTSAPALALGQLIEPVLARCPVGRAEIVVSVGIGVIERGVQFVGRIV
jgi:hypothetical protein